MTSGLRFPAVAAGMIAMFLLLMLMSGCVGVTIHARLQQTLSRGDCAGARALLEANQRQYGANARLLFLLDKAMISLQCRDYAAVQDELQAAEDLAEKLWTESLSRHAAAIVTSDYALKYSGEDYERVMIHIVSAIAYLQTTQLDEALVEVRRLDALLNRYVGEYKEDQFYRTDAFARYLSGIIREADAGWDDAYIDYALAVQAYQGQQAIYPAGVPGMLAADLLRVADRVGRSADAQRLLPEQGADIRAEVLHRPDQGKVVLIVFNGDSPQKVQGTVVVPTPGGPVSVAYPWVQPGAAPCGEGILHLNSVAANAQDHLAQVSDINALAVKSLEQKKGRMIAKTIARTAAKQVLIHGIAGSQKNRNQQQTAAVVLNFVNMLALERADTRSWQTLPGQILLTRVWVPAGDYSSRLEICRRLVDLGSVSVAAGKTRFLFYDARYGETASQ